ncbi:heat shock protein HspQ [Mucisphaera sp.]|uniref:heat shock protein HspQ n=1 Tax=Mucisphaera sp. TaxID=2913024 RepID=UPI003D10956E
MSHHDKINIPDYLPIEIPHFAPGQLVRHRNYGYRGVVVDFDLQCKANDLWYENNQTQPDRDQPWYHILVDGSEINTYAAQSSLLPDTNNQPIQHELINHFFDPFENGRYTRNETPWPGWT